MAHDHQHDDATFYQEQLWTIGVCGMLAVVAILMWYLGRLDLILVKQFHLPVLIAGIGLLALVVIRGITLWIAVGKLKPAHAHEHAHPHDHAHHHDHAHSHDHSHDHVHGHEHHHDHGHSHEHQHDHAHGHEHHHDHAHGHDHDHAPVTTGTAQQPSAATHTHDHAHDHDHAHGSCCGHDHDHAHEHGITTTPTGHSHAHDGNTAPAAAAVASGHNHEHEDHGHSHTWNPVRYIVLLLPIVLFLLKLPNEGFSSTYANRHGGGWSEVDPSHVQRVDAKGDGKMTLEFQELKRAAQTPRLKDYLEGRSGEIKGQFMPGPNDKTFTLVRYKMNCCAADAIKLDVLIVCDESISGFKPNDWVAVEGQIQFLPRKDGNGFSPVLLVPTRSQVVAIQAEANPFEQ